MKKRSQAAIDEFVDKCTARWFFEKTSVQLYEQAIKKCPERNQEMKDRLRAIQAEEENHQELLEDVIQRYGGNPTHLTSSARIAKIEAEGVVKVVQNENFASIMETLLNVELVDNSGWEMLKKLASELGDEDAEERFDDALFHEDEHLNYIRDHILETLLVPFKQSA